MFQRYYASTYGRFTTVDRGPANLGAPQTLNRYTYVGGDPVNSSDPSGLCAVDGNSNWWDGEPNGLWSPFPGRCKDNPSWLRMAGNGGVYYEDQWYVYTVPPEPDPCWSAENAGGCGGGGGPSNSPTDVQAGGGGTRSDTINIANFTTVGNQALAVQNDLRWLQVAIAQDPKCDGWLSESWGAIDFMPYAPGSGATMMAVGVGTFPAGTNAVASISGTNLPVGTLITVASNGAFFNAGVNPGFGLPRWVAGGSNAVQAAILLHELAHDLGAAGFEAMAPPFEWWSKRCCTDAQ
jgi:hypothetical protein